MGHESRLIESEQRLIATIADLRKSQQALEIQAQQLADLADRYSEEKTRAEDANQARHRGAAATASSGASGTILSLPLARGRGRGEEFYFRDSPGTTRASR